MSKFLSDPLKDDPDRSKGAEEPDSPEQASNNSMNDQLGHRSPSATQDAPDSDFPEPGQSPEHSSEGQRKKTGT